MDSVNFLPEEMKTKNQGAKKNKKEEVELNIPPKQQAQKKEGVWGFFSGKKLSNPSKTEAALAGKNSKDKNDLANLARVHSDLLKEISQSPKAKSFKPEPVDIQSKIKAPKTDIFKKETDVPRENLIEPGQKISANDAPKRLLRISLIQKIKNWWKKFNIKKKKNIPLVSNSQTNSQPNNSKEQPRKPKISNGLNWVHKLKQLFKRQLRPKKEAAPAEEADPGRLSLVSDVAHDILETNLVKGQKYSFFNWRKTIFINIFSVLGSVVVIAAIYLYLFWVGSQTLVDIQADRELASQREALINLQNQTAEINPLRIKSLAINELLDRHIYWTNLFKYIEDMTLPGVYYDGFVGDLSGKYKLTVVTDNFDNVVQTMKIWQDDKTSGETIAVKEAEAGTPSRSGSANARVGSVNFTINFTISPNLFYRQ